MGIDSVMKLLRLQDLELLCLIVVILRELIISLILSWLIIILIIVMILIKLLVLKVELIIVDI